MSRVRSFIGHWIILVFYAALMPWLFLLVSRAVDHALGFPEQVISPPYNILLAGFALAVALFWILWAYSFLHYVGKGSPVEAFGVALYPTSVLVTSGPYAYTRNPMVLGALFLLLGVALAASSVGGMILIPLLAVAVVIYLRVFEEPGLVRRFGEQYEEYRRRVPALIPRLGA